jgi:oligopeptide transport system permease protein
MIPVLWVIVTLSFLIMRFTPGGPFDSEKPVSEAVRKNIEAKYQLHLPLWKQYVNYLGDMVRMDFGPSFKHKDFTVNQIILRSFPVSIELGIYSMLISVLIGVVLGIWSALHRNRWPDYLSTGISVVGLSVPNMVIGPLLVIVFSLYLKIFPTSGWDSASSKILPSITLALSQLAVISRLMRSGLLEVITKDFIRTARAKGLKEKTIVFKHAMRAAILPVVSYLGPAIAFVITGSVVVEMIFDIPGMGRYFITSALNRDYTVVLGVTIVLSGLVLVMNLWVDLVYMWMDPRVRGELEVKKQ